MLGRILLLISAAAVCLPATIAGAQEIRGYQSAPADTRPSLVAPPVGTGVAEGSYNAPSYNAPSYQGAEELYQPLQTVPPAGRVIGTQPNTVGSQPLGDCTCEGIPAAGYRPTVTYSPAALPPAAYSSTYVPPPPVSPYYSQRVVYQAPVVYRPAVAAPVVYHRPVTPVVASTPQNYYLPPIIPVQNVPAGATIGRGIVGQPTVYVPGQPVRNFLRYLSP